MNIFKRVFCVFLCVLLLSSCAQRENEEVTSENSVTIQTFGVTAEPEETTTAETFNTDNLIITAPPSTAAPELSQTPTVTSAAESSAPTASSYDGYEITPTNGVMYADSSVNVRKAPDADSDRVGHLDKGEQVTVTGLVSNGWIRIKFKDGEYFVNGNYLSAKSSAATSATTTASSATTASSTTTSAATEPASTAQSYEIVDAEGIMVATDKVNVRSLPSADSQKMGSISKGDKVTVTGIVSNGWVRISYNGGDCFVSGEYLDFANETAPDNNTDGNLNIVTNTNSYNAMNYPTQKAVWFAYLDIDEMLKNASKSAFTASVAKAFDEVVSLGCNTVYVHVRSFGDAYYYSSYYPFTAAYSDTLGVAPSYDPLEIMISEAHARGLSFHAWINPMRTTTKSRYAEMDSSYTLKQWYDSSSTNGTFMVYDSDTGYYWLSPAYAAVRQLICNGVAEIVSRYNVDAIHIDDYFYPTTSSSFDKAAFEASGASDRAAWRRGVVNTLVKEIYSTVKACNSTVLFGVSPQGNIENNRDRLYADVETWCSVSGYLDYIVPQIYYGFNDKLSFSAAAEQWADLVTLPNVSLICGVAAYKVGVNSEWSSGEILKKQTDYISDMRNFDGIAYYRHGSLFGSASSSERLMKSELPGLKQSIAGF